MGIKSEGMVLASRDESGLSLIRPEHRKENGSDIRRKVIKKGS